MEWHGKGPEMIDGILAVFIVVAGLLGLLILFHAVGLFFVWMRERRRYIRKEPRWYWRVK